MPFCKTYIQTLVRIHQPFFRTFLILYSRFFLYLAASECNTTSDWLTHTESEVVLLSKTKDVLPKLCFLLKFCETLLDIYFFVTLKKVIHKDNTSHDMVR